MTLQESGHFICGDEIPSVLGIFDFSTAHPLLFYSYIPIALLSVFIGYFIYKSDRKSLRSKLLFLMTILFTLWIFNILVQWVASYHSVLMFAWQLTALFEVSLFFITTYLAYVFINKKDIPHFLKAALLILSAGVAILIPTKLNILAYDIENCEGIVGILWNAIYILEPALIVFIAALGFSRWKKEVDPIHRRQVVIFTTGLVVLLTTFFASNFYGEITKVYEFNLWGPVGMLVFFSLLGYMMVRFRTFNIKIFATQALVLFITLLIGAKLFYNTNTIDTILNLVTLTFFVISGVFLIRSVRVEVQQRQRLQQLSQELEKANLTLAETNQKLKSLDKLKTEFLSLASHQLRSPLTAIKGYASMLDEGAFGKLNQEQDTAAKRIYASAQGLVNLVEDLLNVSKIEQGGMQYEFMPTDLSKAVTELAGEMRIPAENKKLELRVSVPKNDRCMISADPMKIRQVFLNLVDNSIKYTQAGFVEIGLKRDEQNNVVFYVKDTGVGVTPETKAKLFEKFSRGEGGKMNTGGSGLGLYLAHEIVKAHNGSISVESEGLGKGTLFVVTLPAVASQKNGSFITT